MQLQEENLWHGFCIMNFLISSMVFAFLISLLFPFKGLSWGDLVFCQPGVNNFILLIYLLN